MGASRLLAAAAALIALAGCSLGQSPSASASPNSSSTPTTGRSAAPTASTAGSSCRLPVASADAPTDGNAAHGTAGHGGFIQLPGGAFTADPQSLGTYDAAVHRWLPVPRAWVSPDGTRYAWPEYRSTSGPATGIIHVTEATSGTDHALTVPAPSMPVSFETAGVYVTRVIPNSDAPGQGLGLLDPQSGVLKQVIADGSWAAIAGTLAYGVDNDASAPGPTVPGPGGGNRLRSVDLGTGTVQPVQTFPSTLVSIAGVQGTTPVLLLQGADRTQVRAGSAVLYDQPRTDPAPAPPVVVDGTTLWMGGAGAVWRSTAGGSFQKLAVPLQFAAVAGACR